MPTTSGIVHHAGKPFEGYLRTRGLEVREPSRIDNAAIEKLVDILINPTMKTPQRLLHAVFYVEEMSSPLAADSLLKLAIQAGMPFDENENHTLADVVMQVWLFDSKLVESQHAWQTWKTPRRMASIAKVTIDRARATQSLRMANGLVSQWLSVGEYRSCFCVANQSVPSAWIIEGRLPNGDNVQLASYETDLFDPANPRYVTMKAMCGLPIRFVAATPQTNARLWVVFKS